MPLNLRTFELAGAPAEIGRRHGQLLGVEIRQLRRGLLHYLARVSLYAGALPLFALLQHLARRFWPYTPASLREEMAGVAAGAGLGLASILLLNVVDDLANNSPRCSALAVGESRTVGGAYLMGRNLDYPLFIDLLLRLQTLFVIEPQQGQAFASLAWPGYVGVCTGMNRAGVALAQLAAISRDRTLQGTPAALRFRHALESSATVGEAAAAVASLPGTIGNNLLLCSPGEAMVLELSARRAVRRGPIDGLITATNHYQSPEMAPLTARFPAPPPFSVLGAAQFTEAYSRARNARLQELAKPKVLGPADLKTILADAGVANAGTAVCTLFDPAGRTLWIARGKQAPVNRGPFAAVRPWG
jgi:hypothetical protein